MPNKQDTTPVRTYPSVRHHAGGVRSIVVKSEADEAELESKEPGTWFSTPQPRPLPPPPKPELSNVELTERVLKLEKYLADTNETLSELAATLDHPKIQKLIGGNSQ